MQKTLDKKLTLLITLIRYSKREISKTKIQILPLNTKWNRKGKKYLISRQIASYAIYKHTFYI